MTDKKKCFVISPIGAAESTTRILADFFLEEIVRPALGEQFDVLRADNYSAVDNITSQVIEAIYEADLIVADLTDRNPNVYYELGVAHSYKKHVIPMITEGQEIPFDNNPVRTISYSLRTYQGKAAARTALSAAAVETMAKAVSNPVTNALGLGKETAKGDDQSQLLVSVMESIADLSEKVATQERRWLKQTSNTLAKALGIEPQIADIHWSGGDQQLIRGLYEANFARRIRDSEKTGSPFDAGGPSIENAILRGAYKPDDPSK